MTTIRSLAIAGAGGHGRVVADCAECAGWGKISFYDDELSPGSVSGNWGVAGRFSDLLYDLGSFAGYIVAIGDNQTRLYWHSRFAERGGKPVSVIHPGATVSAHCTLGPGSVVAAGAILNIGVHTGKTNIINTGATVDHDCTLADGVHISPGSHLAGGVSVGSGSWIGAGAVVRENITIGEGVIVGAGCVVVRSIDDGMTVVGNPARLLES